MNRTSRQSLPNLLKPSLSFLPPKRSSSWPREVLVLDQTNNKLSLQAAADAKELASKRLAAFCQPTKSNNSKESRKPPYIHKISRSPLTQSEDIYMKTEGEGDGNYVCKVNYKEVGGHMRLKRMSGTVKELWIFQRTEWTYGGSLNKQGNEARHSLGKPENDTRHMMQSSNGIPIL
jgi:hypothetical protein